MAAAFVAFMPSGPEMIVILVVGIMLFGRRLPEVGKAVGRTVVQLRQGLNKLKSEMELDSEVSELRDSFRDARDSVRGVRDSVNRSIEAPRRAFEDPAGLLTNLTDESLASLAPSAVEAGDGQVGGEAAGTVESVDTTEPEADKPETGNGAV